MIRKGDIPMNNRTQLEFEGRRRVVVVSPSFLRAHVFVQLGE